MTNINVTIGASSADADWEARSTGSGVLFATRFDTEEEFSEGVFPDAQADHLSWYAGDFPSGTHSLRIAVLNDDGTSNGTWTMTIAPDGRIFGPAQTDKKYYIQFRQKGPANFMHAAYPGTNDGYANGQKHLILSHSSASNQNNEVVIEDSRQMGGPTWYWQDGSGFETNWPYVAAINDYRMQAAVDVGGAESTYAECVARYGLMAGYTVGDNIGTPTTPTGGFAYRADEWMTFEVCVDFSAGFGAVQVTIWCAHEDEAPKKIVDEAVMLGTANGGHNAFWLLPYCTNRTSNGGYDTHTLYSEIITSLDPIPFPEGFPP